MQLATVPPVLRTVPFDLFEPLQGHTFDGRPTVAMTIAHQGCVLIVKSAKGGWGPPQGEIEGYDGTLLNAFLREGAQEIGLRDGYSTRRAVLGEFVNPMPKDRTVDYTHKHVLVVGCVVHSKQWIALNSENVEFAFVKSEDALRELMNPSEERPQKFCATCEAINEMNKLGFVPWKCDSRWVH